MNKVRSSVIYGNRQPVQVRKNRRKNDDDYYYPLSRWRIKKERQQKSDIHVFSNSLIVTIQTSRE